MYDRPMKEKDREADLSQILQSWPLEKVSGDRANLTRTVDRLNEHDGRNAVPESVPRSSWHELRHGFEAWRESSVHSGIRADV